MKREKAITHEEASVRIAKMDQGLRGRIISALKRTLDAIHSDLADAAGVDEVIDPETLREAAADYIHSYHRDAGAYELFETMNFTVRDLLLEEAFPTRRRRS